MAPVTTLAAPVFRYADNPESPPLKAPFEILEVRDTRRYDVDFSGPDERWYPIPGSGLEHQCDRCGRIHEVHAHVIDATGRSGIVGTGCMGPPSRYPAIRS